MSTATARKSTAKPAAKPAKAGKGVAPRLRPPSR